MRLYWFIINFQVDLLAIEVLHQIIIIHLVATQYKHTFDRQYWRSQIGWEKGPPRRVGYEMLILVSFLLVWAF